mmetsp:Transcript_48026/g.118879  ORF Transcript_48026/g.118879 Transcript_48026/m.118879 type:complete len:218 (+) Transcript_48026:646-1299(+)
MDGSRSEVDGRGALPHLGRSGRTRRLDRLRGVRRTREPLRLHRVRPQPRAALVGPTLLVDQLRSLRAPPHTLAGEGECGAVCGREGQVADAVGGRPVVLLLVVGLATDGGDQVSPLPGDVGDTGVRRHGTRSIPRSRMVLTPSLGGSRCCELPQHRISGQARGIAAFLGAVRVLAAAPHLHDIHPHAAREGVLLLQASAERLQLLPPRRCTSCDAVR